MSFLTIFILILANLVVVFSWIFAKNVNDYFDKKEDSLSNKGNPFISKQFTRSELIVIYGMVLLMSLGISYLIGYAFFFFNILTLSVSFLYSCPPMRLKRILFFSHLCIGLASGIVLLQGFSLVGNIMPLNNLNLKLFLWITLAFFLGSHLKDIKDYKGDKNAGIKTLPTVFGERNAKIMITLILSILFLFSVILFGLIYLVPFAILCALGASYFLNRKNYKEVYVFLIYFSFFVVVAIFLLRSLISQIV
jgi:4-hydroxybenzoate polyprenyltransferase